MPSPTPIFPRRLSSVDDVAGDYGHVYVSPHFDDVALSLGGSILRKRREAKEHDRSLVVAVFAGRPPEGASGDFVDFQYRAWGNSENPWPTREKEERSAMAALGADYLWLHHLDAIYRGEQYTSDEELFGPIKSGDRDLALAVALDLGQIVGRCPRASLYVPLAVGGHVDHRVCFEAGMRIHEQGRRVFWYEDLPYAASASSVRERIVETGLPLEAKIVDVGCTIDEKCRIVLSYESQARWIFRGHGDPSQALRAYHSSIVGGQTVERVWLAVDRRDR